MMPRQSQSYRWWLIRIVAPKHRKHKAIVFEADTYTYHGSAWDGGSREFATLVDSCGRKSSIDGPTAPPQFGGGDPVKIAIPENGYVVVLGTFRGKTATAKVYLNKLED